ncbi:MAG TPA: hypothetical protein VLB44_17885, partial [Kofleriaceae bacterium]|nr:hypothetical protein [Kofleriaceae bacterium]
GDRDLAMRKQLARYHIEEATAALARGNGEADRRDAMRAAGRAIALDPSATDAVDIVSRLVLEPPAVAPAEVDEVLERIDTETARHQGRLSALAVLGYLGFIPLIVWSGLHDTTWLAVFISLVIGCALHTWTLTRQQRLTSGVIYVNAAINALLIGTVCRLVGPFIIAPTLVLTTMMAYAAHPRIGRVGPLSLILAASIAVPWCLELAGVFPSTYSFAHGALVLRSAVIDLGAVPVQLANALLLVSLLAVIALLSRLMAERQREASKRAELQAWHLRQLVVPAS